MMATQRQVVGALMLSGFLGLVAAVMLGPGGGVVSGALVLLALIVSKNL